MLLHTKIRFMLSKKIEFVEQNLKIMNAYDELYVTTSLSLILLFKIYNDIIFVYNTLINFTILRYL